MLRFKITLRLTAALLVLFISLLSAFFAAPELESFELIFDGKFERGFYVRSLDPSASGGAEKLGVFAPMGGNPTPAWQIAQWNSGGCLWENRLADTGFSISDGATKTVTLDPSLCSLALALNSVNVYNGSPASLAAWPHLLMEQSTDSHTSDGKIRREALCDAEKIIVSLDLRLNRLSCVEVEGDEVRAAQFLVYVYLSGVKNPNDFVWFGLQLFDSRGMMAEHFALDKGSGKMVFGVSTQETYSLRDRLSGRAPLEAGGDFVHVEVDIKPYIERLIARDDSGFSADVQSPEDLYISGTNIGWEIIGSFDAEVEFKNYSVKTLFEKEATQ